MFKYHFYTIIIILSIILSNNAVALGCSGTPLNNAALTLYLENKTICVNSPEFSQEEHHIGGELWDYKKGDLDSVDPRERIGGWLISGDEISYTYLDGGGSGTYTIQFNSGTYAYCNGSSQIANIYNRVNLGSACPPP